MDDFENDAIKIAIFSEEGSVAAGGRLHLNSPQEAQIRYMAVDEGHRGMGLGKDLLKALEDAAISTGAKFITLNARESAASFYEKHGYRITGPAHTLFGEIPHWAMRKNL